VFALAGVVSAHESSDRSARSLDRDSPARGLWVFGFAIRGGLINGVSIMRRCSLCVVAIVCLAAPAQGALQIRDIRAVYGKLGPDRPNSEYFPCDDVVFRYLVSGARVDERGSVDCEVSVETIDPDGKFLPKQGYVAQGILNFGGDSFPASARVPLPENAKPGTYSLRVRVRDRLSDNNEEATFNRSLKVSPPKFAIVAPHFTFDQAGLVDAPAGGAVDQTLYIWMSVIGFDRSRKRIDTEMNIRVMDSKGKELTPNPIRIKGTVDDSSVADQAVQMRFRGELHLNQPGTFTVSVTIVDWISKGTIKFETPIRVHPVAG
jgi:hypothetical protein